MYAAGREPQVSHLKNRSWKSKFVFGGTLQNFVSSASPQLQFPKRSGLGCTPERFAGDGAETVV
jgi:hypothetical protein